MLTPRLWQPFYQEIRGTFRREAPEYTRKRRPRILVLLAVAMTPGFVVSSRAMGEPHPVQLATTDLSAGAEGTVRIDVEGFSSCSLRFSGPGQGRASRLSSGPYGVRLNALSVEWRWDVATGAVPGLWRAVVECSRAGDPSPRRTTIDIDVSNPAPRPQVSLVAIASMRTTFPPESDSSTLSAVDQAQIAAALVALVGLLVVAWELLANSRRAKDERAAGYLGRYQDPDFGLVSGRARGFLETTSHDERARKKERHSDAQRFGPAEPLLPTRWPPDPRVPLASRHDLNQYATFFEELGAAFNAGVLDKRTVSRVLGTVIYLSYRHSEWFLVFRNHEEPLPVKITKPIGRLESLRRSPIVYRRRRRSGPFQEWGEMCRELRRLKPELAEHDRMFSSVGADSKTSGAGRT